MGLFGKIGKGLKKVGKAATKVASFVPGPVGLAASAGNAALEGKPVLKSVAGDLGRNSKVAGTLLPLALSGGAAAPALGGGGGAMGMLGGGAGLLKKAGSFALDNPDLIAGGLSFLEGRDSERKADRYRDKAMQLAEQEYAAKAPLRSNALSILQREPPPMLPRYRGQNPFSR